MLFNSVAYALFLPTVLAVYWTVRGRTQNLILLAASYVFYGAWDWRFLSLIIVSTLVDFGVGIGLERSRSDGWRRALVGVSVLTNLGILGFFKYAGFFTASLTSLFGEFGVSLDPVTLDIILPVGISFYTFQTLSYTIDVYRGDVRATRNLLDFATFVAFFPQLVAGPIERASRLLPQIAQPRRGLSGGDVASGLSLIVLGLFKKVVIADGLAPFVDQVFSSPESVPWLPLVGGLWAFGLQLYADFSGYSLIARGSARLLGIELMRNFEEPYLSRNIAEFWRRWHVSLSTWLRDYLYIPLGGNHRGPRRTAINLFLTMLLGGLWHGAGWTFLIWGGFHGALLVGHRYVRPASTSRSDRGEMPRLRHVPAILLTFQLTSLSWILFRSPTLTAAWQYAEGILTLRPGTLIYEGFGVLVPAALLTLGLDLWQRALDRHDVLVGSGAFARGTVLAGCIAGVVVFSGGTPSPFIYFQF